MTEDGFGNTPDDVLKAEAEERNQRAMERFRQNVSDARELMGSFSAFGFLLAKRANGVVGDYSRDLGAYSTHWLDHMVNSSAMSVGGYLDRGVIGREQAREAMGDVVQMAWGVMLEGEGLAKGGELTAEVVGVVGNIEAYMRDELWEGSAKNLKDSLEQGGGWKLDMDLDVDRARKLCAQRNKMKGDEIERGVEAVRFERLVAETTREFNERWIGFKPGNVEELTEEVTGQLIHDDRGELRQSMGQSVWAVMDYWEAVVREIYSWQRIVDPSHKEWLAKAVDWSVKEIEEQYGTKDDSSRMNRILTAYFDEDKVFWLKKNVIANIAEFVRVRGNFG